jgi:hypothetical protein
MDLKDIAAQAAGITAELTVSSKPWWQSKTIIGAGVSGVASVAGLVGYQVAPDLVGDISVTAATFAGVVGSALSIWGRLKATTQIQK